MNKYTALAVLFVLLFSSGVAAQNKKRSRAVSISPTALRAALMRDGLRAGLEDCDGLGAPRITSRNIDLNNDEQAEIVATVTSGCFGAHGSKVWIYRVTGGKLSALLSMEDGAFEAASSNATNGFRDLTLVAGTAVVVYKYTYKFGGRVYRQTEGRRYLRNESGELVLQEILSQ